MKKAVLKTVGEKLPEIFLIKECNVPPIEREYVLFRYNHLWKAMGPVDMTVASALVRVFHSMNIRCFICLEEEFQDKGLPSDSMAVIYFPENELSWEEVLDVGGGSGNEVAPCCGN
ncbi:MAG: hypothetical protein PHI97_28560 [Desulfobulbus sp.]|nr:hypothetical protein [Desulfobulbus sp.]